MTESDTHVEIFKDHSGSWRFRGVAANGETIAQSEAYATSYGARRGAKRVFPNSEVQESDS